VTAGKIVTLVLIAASLVVCVPLACLDFALLIHAPNLSARPIAFCPSVLIFGAWFAVWWAWRKEHLLIGCLVLSVLLGIFAYGWSTFDVP
jgi:hypothetical protein